MFETWILQNVRFQSAQPSAAAVERQKKKEKAMQKKAVHSKSFAQNIFRGMVETEQVFPYPDPMDEEQKENLAMLVPIAERVMGEQNDPLLNDAQESVPEETTQALRELGAFGLQVSNYFYNVYLIPSFNHVYIKCKNVRHCLNCTHANNASL